jgi:hypothetical protein
MQQQDLFCDPKVKRFVQRALAAYRRHRTLITAAWRSRLTDESFRNRFDELGTEPPLWFTLELGLLESMRSVRRARQLVERRETQLELAFDEQRRPMRRRRDGGEWFVAEAAA